MSENNYSKETKVHEANFKSSESPKQNKSTFLDTLVLS